MGIFDVAYSSVDHINTTCSSPSSCPSTLPSLHLIQAVIHLNRSPFCTPVQSHSSHFLACSARPSITYLESVMIFRCSSWGCFLTTSRIAASSPVWLEWVLCCSLALRFLGLFGPYHTLLLASAVSRHLSICSRLIPSFPFLFLLTTTTFSHHPQLYSFRNPPRVLQPSCDVSIFVPLSCFLL